MAARCKVLSAMVAAALLGACAPQGDFGRPKPNALNDGVMPWAGNHLAAKRGEPVSSFDMTDDEKELRALGYLYIMPDHPRDRANQFWAELRRTRIMDQNKGRADPRGYCKTLMGESYASSHTRYAKLHEDILADRARLPPFCARARDVTERDRIRRQALPALTDLEAGDVRNAHDRMFENRMIIEWVKTGLRDHIEGYRCTLNRLMAGQPEPDAVAVERALLALESDLANWCGGMLGAVPAERETGPVRPYYPGTRKPVHKGYDPDEEMGPIIPK